MDEQTDIKDETLKSLDLLNKQMADLLQLQRKSVSGYDFLNAKELAELLGESIKTVYTRVHKRQIPFYKPGGRILLFNLEEIRKWIQSGRNPTMDELREMI